MHAFSRVRWVTGALVLVSACNGKSGSSQLRPGPLVHPSQAGQAGSGDDDSDAGASPAAGRGGNVSASGAGHGGSGRHRGGAGGTDRSTGGTSHDDSGGEDQGGTSGTSGRGGTGHGGSAGHSGGSPGSGATAALGGQAGDDGASGATASAGTGAGSSDGGTAGQPSGGVGGAGGNPSEVPGEVLVQGVSVRKRVRSAAGLDVVLEEELQSFNASVLPRTRVRLLTHALDTAALWPAPDGQYVSDLCVHPSGEVSVVLISEGFVVSVLRLDPELTELGSAELHDPDVANDPNASTTGVTDLAAGPAVDAARIGANGEGTFTVVASSLNAVIGYRQTFAGSTWSAPQRTLIEPPAGLTPNIPIGGSFDTFGAIVDWFRAPLDMDEDGNALVAVWANPKRIRTHVAAFADGLTPLPGDPTAPGAGDSDIILSKIDRDGHRAWSRVVGSMHEDEPYAVRAHGGSIAVVGRARRLPGFDNTAWDALVAVTQASGEPVGSATLELTASSILLGVDARPAGGWLLAGSDGWWQNPTGLSVLGFGTKLLAELPSLDAEPIRIPLPAGPRHNELHSVLALPSGIAYAGHEDGPIMHTGDGDESQIHATGVLGFVAN